MYRVLSLSLVAAALALFSSVPAQAQLPGSQNPRPGAGQANPANPANAGQPTHEGKFVEAEGNNKFVMTDQTGRNEHTHTLARDARVLCDGKVCKLSDLRKGALIRVWTSPTDKEMAIKVEATTRGQFPNQPGTIPNRPGTIPNRPGTEVNR